MLVLFACTPTPTTSADDTGTPSPIDPADWPSSVGGERPAPLVTPSADAYDGGTLPLVVLLHGYSANATLQDLYFGLSERVDAQGFALLLPEGTTDAGGFQFWNATPACCDFYGSGVDDAGYLLGLVDEVEQALPVESVLFVGHSNGGFMSYRMACEAADRIDGIAVLAGSTFDDEADCAASGPVAVLHAHGDADPDVPYDGSLGYPGAEETVARWADRAGCTSGPTAAGTRDYDGFVAGEEAAVSEHSGCAEDVRLWRLQGSGHVPAPTEAFRDDLVAWLMAR